MKASEEINRVALVNNNNNDSIIRSVHNDDDDEDIVNVQRSNSVKESRHISKDEKKMLNKKSNSFSVNSSSREKQDSSKRNINKKKNQLQQHQHSREVGLDMNVTSDLLNEWRTECDELVIALHAVDDNDNDGKGKRKDRESSNNMVEGKDIIGEFRKEMKAVRTGNAMLRSSIAAGIVTQPTTTSSSSSGGGNVKDPLSDPLNNNPLNASDKLRQATYEVIPGSGYEYGGEDHCSPVKFPLTSLALKTGKETYTFGPPGSLGSDSNGNISKGIISQHESLKNKLDCYEMPKYIHTQHSNDVLLLNETNTQQQHSMGVSSTLIQNKGMNSRSSLNKRSMEQTSANNKITVSNNQMNSNSNIPTSPTTVPASPTVTFTTTAATPTKPNMSTTTTTTTVNEKSRRRLAAFLGSDVCKPDFTQPSGQLGGIGSLLSSLSSSELKNNKHVSR